ncbi:recombination protein RecR [Candidatus Kaiserbacteria bacterium]|nr:recombination protein RecR [Candidatus Kaiserbacteria bacterium]
MTSFDELVRHFERFPGIGPRQARRFVYHLLTEDPQSLRALADAIADVQAKVTECAHCFRYFARDNGNTLCEICNDANRNHELLMVVERDSDIPPIERSGIYDGYYFVLGGTVPLLEPQENIKLRGGALKGIAEMRAKEGLAEVILAFSVNPDGENTARYVGTLLKETEEKNIKISTLGRGLSTGSELEYADPETIKNALKNRT